MSNIESLTRYIQEHPFHFNERWRLAKKLYKTGEYEMALVHLLVLEEDWEPKASLNRYLGATLSRLDRVEDAVRVLEKGVKVWPKDLPMLEQLAMLLKKSGRPEDSVTVLEKIMAIEPTYVLPPHAKAVLLHKKLKGHRERSGQFQAATVELVCDHCGAQNTDGRSVCWQCEGSLDFFGESLGDLDSDSGSDFDSMEKAPEAVEVADWITFGLRCMVVIGAVWSGVCTYAALGQLEGRTSGYGLSTTLGEWWSVDMVMTRIVLGVVVLLLGPFLLQGAYRVAGVQHVDLGLVLLQALLFSTLGYGLTWVAGVGVTAWLGSLLVGSFFVLAYPFWRQWSTVLVTYGMYWILVVFVGASTFMTMHGVNALAELSSVLAYSKAESHESTLEIEGTLPLQQEVRWESTGSGWLDEQFLGVELRITVLGELSVEGYDFELRGQDGSVLFYETIHSREMVLHTDSIVPGVVYTIESRGEPVQGTPIDLQVELMGLMPLKSLLPLKALEAGLD